MVRNGEKNNFSRQIPIKLQFSFTIYICKLLLTCLFFLGIHFQRPSGCCVCRLRTKASLAHAPTQLVPDGS